MDGGLKPFIAVESLVRLVTNVPESLLPESAPRLLDNELKVLVASLDNLEKAEPATASILLMALVVFPIAVLNCLAPEAAPEASIFRRNVLVVTLNHPNCYFVLEDAFCFLKNSVLVTVSSSDTMSNISSRNEWSCMPTNSK